jgi:cytochrome c-type biogenesis protein CcmH
MLSRALLALALCLMLAPPASAFEVDKPLADPAAEARAREISTQLRCLVCQNQAISESNAPLARDLRQVVRERVAAGDSDAQVVGYVVARYGDWVLLDPPFKLTTLVLWLGPALLLLLAAGGVAIQVRRGGGVAAQAPLSEDEQRRLSALLDDDSGA